MCCTDDEINLDFARGVLKVCGCVSYGLLAMSLAYIRAERNAEFVIRKQMIVSASTNKTVLSSNSGETGWIKQRHPTTLQIAVYGCHLNQPFTLSKLVSLGPRL
jgi:hypothetical protein